MSFPLVENILAQPEAIRTVAAHQFAEGRNALLRSGALLRSRARIVLSGMGGSRSACIPLSYSLAAQGVLAPVIETSELLHSYSPALDENTAVILVSRSGETVEVTKLLPVLRERRVTVIGVTNNATSTLGSSSTECLVLHSPADQFVAIQTYTATVVVLLLLGASFSGELGFELHGDLDATAEVLSCWIPECFEASERWSAFLESASPLYLLGRGASLGPMHAGVLLFHEVAKAPAVGMPAANFRHGPVEVVDEKFHSLVFSCEPATAALDAALANDIRHMHGQVRWVGPGVNGFEVVPLCPWPATVPNRFASVFQTIPMQIAAYRLARIRGVVPGEFRRAPLVTVSETGFAGPDRV